MKNLVSHRPDFTDRFESHLARFIEKYRLFDKKQDLSLAVSGGVDSMALALAISKLKRFGYSNKLNIIHINHGTRKEQYQEAQLVEEFSLMLRAQFKSHLLVGLKEYDNFEHNAREARYKIFREESKDRLLLAHHIDDSYEWSFLQGLRSSQVRSSLGIPVVHGKLVRPFMCVTKDQIRKYAQYYDLPYLEDPTNEYARFERNFLRTKVISVFASRHPSFLKHYVRRQNRLTKMIDKNLLPKVAMDEYRSKHATLLIGDWINREQVSKAIYRHSRASRGVIESQLDKLEMAMANNKTGPLIFSGDVHVYCIPGATLITSQAYLFNQSHHIDFDNDEHLYKVFDREEFKQTFSRIIEKIDLRDFPFWVEVKGSCFAPFNKRVYPGWDKFDAKLRFEGRNYISAISLLRHWSKPQHLKRKLKLKFVIRV